MKKIFTMAVAALFAVSMSAQIRAGATAFVASVGQFV